MNKKIIILITAIVALFCSCNQPLKKNNHAAQNTIKPKYARGFYVEINNDIVEAFVKDPWDSTKNLAHYVFVKKTNRNSIVVDGATIIKTPCQSVACLSSPEIGFIVRLGLEKSITGISQKEYIKEEKILERIAAQKVIDLGPFEAYNTEKLMALNPEVLFAAPFKDNKYGKIIQTGVPMAYCASYMEETPLGRAEWIKFIALFFDKYDEACSIFDSIENNYNSASDIAKKAAVKPVVFSGKMYQSIWYISGLKSYMAQFFIDAGAKYAWDDKKHAGSDVPANFEQVYERCNAADFWVILEYAPMGYSYQKLLSENEKYSYFDAFKKKNLIFCNTEKSAYYDKGIIEPDLILKDFIAIFHPDLLPNYIPTYFKRLSYE